MFKTYVARWTYQHLGINEMSVSRREKSWKGSPVGPSTSERKWLPLCSNVWGWKPYDTEWMGSAVVENQEDWLNGPVVPVWEGNDQRVLPQLVRTNRTNPQISDTIRTTISLNTLKSKGCLKPSIHQNDGKHITTNDNYIWRDYDHEHPTTS